MTYFRSLCIALVLALFPAFAFAATLTFSPSSGSYGAGQDLTVNVYVSSADQAMNAVSGTISFPANRLSVVSISKTNSIISLWTADPTFSNSDGSVNFEGIVLNPGFTGNNGKVISITFRALSAGNANMDFDSGSVLANDGSGTSIPTTLGSADFTITGAVAPAQTAPTPAATTSAPIAAITPPAIHYASSLIHTGDAIVIEGTSQYTDSKVLLWLKYGDSDAVSSVITTNLYGDFTFADTDGAKVGSYQAWAQSVDENGNISSSSPIYSITVVSPFVIIVAGIGINIFVGLAIIFILLLMLIFGGQRILAKRYKTKKEMSETIVNANKLANVKFNYYNDYVNAQLDLLERDEKMKNLPGAGDVIENIRKHILDFKDFIDKENK